MAVAFPWLLINAGLACSAEAAPREDAKEDCLSRAAELKCSFQEDLCPGTRCCTEALNLFLCIGGARCFEDFFEEASAAKDLLTECLPDGITDGFQNEVMGDVLARLPDSCQDMLPGDACPQIPFKSCIGGTNYDACCSTMGHMLNCTGSDCFAWLVGPVFLFDFKEMGTYLDNLSAACQTLDLPPRELVFKRAKGMLSDGVLLPPQSSDAEESSGAEIAGKILALIILAPIAAYIKRGQRDCCRRIMLGIFLRLCPSWIGRDGREYARSIGMMHAEEENEEEPMRPSAVPPSIPGVAG